MKSALLLLTLAAIVTLPLQAASSGDPTETLPGVEDLSEYHEERAQRAPAQGMKSWGLSGRCGGEVSPPEEYSRKIRLYPH